MFHAGYPARRPAGRVRSDSADYSFDTVVEVVEPLGFGDPARPQAGPNVIVARVEPTVRVSTATRCGCAAPERVRFFDNRPSWRSIT